MNAVNGVATFSNLTLNKVGTGYTLTAAASGLTGATSQPFNDRTARRPGWSFNPSRPIPLPARAISPAITVAVQDADGNTVTTATTPVTLALGANPGSATLGGTLTVNAVNGVATFNNLTLDKVGTGYTLTAAAAGLTGATSRTFTVTAGPPAALVFQSQPTNTVAGAAISPAVTVVVAGRRRQYGDHGHHGHHPGVRCQSRQCHAGGHPDGECGEWRGHLQQSHPQ